MDEREDLFETIAQIQRKVCEVVEERDELKKSNKLLKAALLSKESLIEKLNVEIMALRGKCARLSEAISKDAEYGIEND